MQGWIKLHRKITESIVFKNEKCLKIWIWCLTRADHKPTVALIGRQRIELNKGQFIMGGIKTEQILDIARTTIYYWIDFLCKEGMIDIKKTNKYTIITIKNWDRYQVVDIKKTSNDTTDGQQKDTDKNDKEVLKNDKEVTIVSGEAAEDLNPLIAKFKEVNPSYEKLFRNTTQRASLSRLVKKWGVDKIGKAIDILPQTNAQRYAPTITTPLQLEDKLGSLVSFLNREKNNNKIVEV